MHLNKKLSTEQSTGAIITRMSTGALGSQFQEERNNLDAFILDNQVGNQDEEIVEPVTPTLNLNKCGVLKFDQNGWKFDPISKNAESKENEINGTVSKKPLSRTMKVRGAQPP